MAVKKRRPHPSGAPRLVGQESVGTNPSVEEAAGWVCLPGGGRASGDR